MVENILVIISGPSGVGKSEIAKRLLNYQDLNIQELTGFTTRPPRPREVDGKDYYFISKEEFSEKIADNQFLYYVEYNNNYYGNPVNSFKEGLLTKNILQIATVEAHQKLKAGWTDSKIVSFWLQPPSRDKLLSNLRKRGDKEEEIAKRLAIAETEIPFAIEYDHFFIVNDNLDQVAEEIKIRIFDSLLNKSVEEFQKDNPVYLRKIIREVEEDKNSFNKKKIEIISSGLDWENQRRLEDFLILHKKLCELQQESDLDIHEEFIKFVESQLERKQEEILNFVREEEISDLCRRQAASVSSENMLSKLNDQKTQALILDQGPVIKK